MATPSGPTRYAENAVQCRAGIERNEKLGKDVYRLRFACPEIAARSVPGQFVMVRAADHNDPLIGRPLAIYDLTGRDPGQYESVDVIYRVMGKGTGHLARMQPGQMLDVWGPLGNGFPPASGRPLIMVAGGIGQTPFLLLGKEARGIARYGIPPRKVVPHARVWLCYGAQTAQELIAVEDFSAAGIDVRLATDDGTSGHHGLVTDLLVTLIEQLADAPEVVCCGPEPMLREVAKITAEKKLVCRVSLETPMACGIGICYSCVTRVRTAKGAWDYQRTCVNGPVFDAEQLVWDE